PLARIGSRSLFRDVACRAKCAGRAIVNSTYTYTVSLLGRAINPVNHCRSQAPFEGLRLARPIRISASYHNSPIATGHSDQFLWVRLPPLNIQHTVTNVLKIDE